MLRLLVIYSARSTFSFKDKFFGALIQTSIAGRVKSLMVLSSNFLSILCIYYKNLERKYWKPKLKSEKLERGFHATADNAYAGHNSR